MNKLWQTMSAVACALVLSCPALAQCDIDFDFGEVAFGVSPDPAAGETFVDGMLDEDYFDVLHILIPATAAGIDSTYPPTLPVDSVIVLADVVAGDGTYSGVVFTDTVTNETFHANEIGLEVALNNDGASPNGNTFMGGGQYCAAIQGVPNRSGVYRISIDIEAWATIFTPFNAPFTFDNFTLRVNCPLIEGVEVVNANSVDGTQGQLTVTLADGIVATEIAWFNSSGVQIGTGDSVLVDNPGVFSVQVTTEECQSAFGGWIVIDEGLDCTMTATVEVTDEDEGESNGSATVIVEGASGPWSATWYNVDGLLLGSGETLDGLSGGEYSVLVVDSIGCSIEIESFEVLTGMDEALGAWSVFPNPAIHTVVLTGLPIGHSWALLAMDGRILEHGRGQSRVVVNVSHLPHGMYMVRVASAQGTSVQRVLVQR